MLLLPSCCASLFAVLALSRRRLLQGIILGCGVGLTAGCTSSPIIDPSKAASPQPTPTLDGDRRGAAQLELDLATACTALGQQVDARRDWFVATAESHRQRHIVLAQRDPFGGAQADHTPIAQFEPSPPSITSVEQFAAFVAQAADEFAALVQAQSEPQRALLFASSAAAARFSPRHALVDGAALPVPGKAVPAPVEFDPYPQNLQLLLGHLQALEFGLEALTGKTANQSASEELRAQLRVRLASASKQIDQVRQLITKAGAQPGPAAAQYHVKADGDDAAKRAEWAKLEANVASAWAAVTATAPTEQRKMALDEFVGQLDRAQSLGQPLTHWPGWQ